MQFLVRMLPLRYVAAELEWFFFADFYKCKHCSRIFADLEHLSKHEENLHKGNKGSASATSDWRPVGERQLLWKCRGCGDIFVTEEKLKAHWELRGCKPKKHPNQHTKKSTQTLDKSDSADKVNGVPMPIVKNSSGLQANRMSVEARGEKSIPELLEEWRALTEKITLEKIEKSFRNTPSYLKLKDWVPPMESDVEIKEEESDGEDSPLAKKRPRKDPHTDVKETDFDARFMDNASLNQLLKMSQVLLQAINLTISRRKDLVQWKKASEAVDWFNKIPRPTQVWPLFLLLAFSRKLGTA